MRRLWSILWLSVAGCLVPAAPAVSLELQTFTLDNGLQVILAPRHETPIIHSLIRYKVGSANEHVGITGISHMLEHMMFKGTREIQTINYPAEVPLMRKQDELFAEILALRRLKIRGMAPPDADSRIEEIQYRIKGLNRSQKLITIQNDLDVSTFRMGFSRLGADTSYDRTHYMEYFPANCLEAWAYFESARMQAPVFREFYAERDVVLEERRQTTETQPEAILAEKFEATAMMAHPYHWDVIGWRSDAENWTRNDVRAYHHLYYAPNNAIIVLVGDFDPKTAGKVIRKYFGRIPSRTIPNPVVLTTEPAQKGQQRAVVRYAATPRLIVGYHRCQAHDPDYPVLELIDAVLGRGRSSRLYKALIASGLAAEFQTGIWEMKRYPGLYTVSATSAGDVPLSRLESLVEGILEGLAHQEISEQELETARNWLTGQLLRQMQDRDSLAVLLAEGADLHGDPAWYNTYLERLQQVSLQDVRRVAGRFFIPEARTVTWLLPPGEEGKDK